MLVLLLALPATAGAAGPSLTPRVLRLIPQVSIRGVALGMTPAQVQAVLGRPDARVKGKQPGIGATLTLTFGLVTVRFDGVQSSAEAVTITTTSHRERTARGVGVGSSEATVRQRVAGARCLEEFGYRHCVVGVQKAGQIVTDFSIGGAGRVTRISLARMLD
ncbi:MAG TPA: hypothetical protein VII98_04360 [Solirubrobacteraceae bacterium]